jgi:Protein of unknown function (DUF2530)
MSLPEREPAPTEPPAAESPTSGGTGRPVPDIQPMEVDLTLLLMVGTGLFALAFVGMMAFHSSLSRAGHGHWPWIALTGAVFGLLGLVLVRRREQARGRARAE